MAASDRLVSQASQYPILTCDDGSELWLKSIGTGTADGSTTHFVGTVAVVGGKRRFEGAKGDNTGTRYSPLSLGADLVTDYTINLIVARAIRTNFGSRSIFDLAALAAHCMALDNPIAPSGIQDGNERVHEG